MSLRAVAGFVVALFLFAGCDDTSVVGGDNPDARADVAVDDLAEVSVDVAPLDAPDVVDATAPDASDAGRVCPSPLLDCGGRCTDPRGDRDHCGACGRACAAGELCQTGACVPSCAASETLCTSELGARCVNTATDVAHCGGCGRACGRDQVCAAGACTVSCTGATTECGGGDAGAARVCVDLQSDRSHCGACGRACGDGMTCVAGACHIACAEVLTRCPSRDLDASTGEVCVDTREDITRCGSCDTACAFGQLCVAGRCQTSCGAGFTDCMGACRDLASDRAHCGTCATACGSGEACVMGACVVSCGGGQVACAGACRDTQSDVNHCGACGQRCAPGQVCAAGACTVSCATGTANCAGTCRDLQRDLANCGACGAACPAGQVCAAGACTVSCGAGTTNCTGTCRDLQSDNRNCGACGNVCAAGSACVAGACAVTCATGTTNCSGTCRDLQSDNRNCGACGTVCPAGQACAAGACAVSCATGTTNCSGTCRDLQNDLANCGACGAACPAGQVCAAGACTVSCVTGTTNCSGTCRDLQSDNRNCGACGNACAAGLACASGVCALTCTAGLTACAGGCRDTQSDNAHCGACGNACPAGRSCVAGSCRVPRSCDELLAQRPGTPTGSYTIDADGDGALAPFTVFCDMETDGGGWTLIASSAGDTNMPRFDATASTPCATGSPTGPCFVGAAQLAALGLVEYRWGNTARAVSTRAPIDGFTQGSPDVSATCVNANEYFRVNQDVATQGMAWSGCDVTEVFESTARCQVMYRPVWNLQRCEGVPVAPGERSSPDYNCSPFGANTPSGGACAAFANVRHWRRGRTCAAGLTYCDGVCVDTLRDPANCGACGRACSAQACVAGACATATSCADLLRRSPGAADGMYTIDPDGAGAGAPVRAYCDMTTGGGGWTLVAASVVGPNMPRFTEAARPCNAATPNAPCTLGAAAITALAFTEFAWSTTPNAVNTRAPIDRFTAGIADVNAICINANEYFRTNQDIASQGMGWTGCVPTEIYSSESACNIMYRPVWNLLTCAGLPIAPGPRSSPDFNCSPFGQNLPFGGSCADFAYMRHWRR